jgi:endonuclease VIII
MPEGPEIRRAADALEALVLKLPLRKVWFKFDALKRHARALSNSQVLSFETRGKAMLTHFSNGQTIYSHNQLYGLWHASPDGLELGGKRDLRLSIHTERAAVFLYSASDITVWPSARINEHPFLVKLGPDVLSQSLQAEHIVERLRSARFVGKNLASLLLDQGFLAGMGNYLRTEVLFYAGLHPSLRPKDLSPEIQHKLAQTLLNIVQRSYQSGGVTNEAAISGQLNMAELDFEGYRFAAFERAGKPCQFCHGTIQRCEMAGRRLYWCDICQGN